MIDDFQPPDQTKANANPVEDTGQTTATNPLESAQVNNAADDTSVGNNDSASTTNYDAFTIPEDDEQIPSLQKKSRFHWPSKKWTIIIVILILLLGIVGAWLIFHHPSKKPAVVSAAAVVKAKPIVSTTVPSDLSGLPVQPAVNKLPVTGVMIENSLDARPQSGLSQASVVFEAVAEGGITRFLALYQDTSPSSVGPIRSVRPYYLQWGLGFDAAFAHVGGSPDALADISTWGVRDLDQFYNGSYYHRITTREAPHNVYTAISTLNQLEDSKGYTSSTFTSWPRKADAPAKHPTAATINLTLSSSDYNVVYSYDPTTNTYNRAEGGSPMIDANTSTQVSPKVVIAIVVPETQGALDASGAYYSDYSVIGNGSAYVFQDGSVVTGTWTKSSNTSQIMFTTSTGSAIKLNAGQTWITAVTNPTNVSYTP